MYRRNNQSQERHHAHRVVEAFRVYNEAAFRDLAKHWGNRKTFMEQMRGKIREGENLLKEGGLTNAEVDAAWDNTSLREDMRKIIAAAEVGPAEQ